MLLANFLGAVARPEDVASIDAIINAIYESVSFTDGQGPDEQRLASLLARDTKLIELDKGEVVAVSLAGFVTRVRQRISEMGLQSFVERELCRRTEVYGGIAHVFSSYEGKRWEGEGERIKRGINSFQLYNDGHRWWVLGILWVDETSEDPIPSAYLPHVCM